MEKYKYYNIKDSIESMKMVLVHILLNAYYGSSERVHWFIALDTIPDKVISIFQELHGRTKLMPTISPLIWTCGQ